MTDSYFSLKPQDQREILQTGAARLGKQAAVLEKDIWLCWVLEQLFSMPKAHPMAFKGGTSLSKIYNIIDRFSEDVDITLDYRHFEDDFDPFAKGASKSQIRKFSDRLKIYVNDYANNVVKPYLEAASQSLETPDDHTLKIDDTGEKIWFSYPSAIEEHDAYFTSDVLIELGGRNVIDPNERHSITAEIAPLTTGLTFPKAEVTVLSPSRTFWEKATLIHVECMRGRLKDSPDRLSRHWYDLTRIAKHQSGINAINDRALFEDVIQHKKVFFNAGYTNYDKCLAGELRLLPDSDCQTGLRSDYEAMQRSGMMYDQPVPFDDLISSISDLESRVNDWSAS